MKSKVCLFLVCTIGSVFAQSDEKPSSIVSENTAVSHVMMSDVKQQYGYLSVGLGPFPLPLPAFAAGYRAQSNHNGVDLSLQVQTIIACTQLKANLLYLHYFNPNLASQFYVGGGVSPSYIFVDSCFRDKNKFLLSPEFVFGQQYRNKSNDLRFFQMQLSYPTITKFKHDHIKTMQFPLVIFSYGIGF